MNLRVRALDFNYADNSTISDVVARFELTDSSGNFINGNIKITREEYEGATGLTEVGALVTERLKERVNTL